MTAPNGVYVNLVLGTATGLAGGIKRIANVTGSPFNDILVGNGGNVLNGGAGRDILIAGAAEVTRLLERTTASLCLDTGHLFLGGVDPAELARAAGSRVSHVHLKDVDAGLMARLAGGRLSYLEAIRAGLYRPLGQGDLDLEAVFGSLQESGYEGWYVLEQDVALAEEPAPGEGPLVAARQSVEFFRALEGLKGRIAK